MSSHHSYDLCLRNGRVVDGGGGASFAGDVALRGDRIAYVGPRAQGDAQLEVELDGAVVAPGFINMLSWASESLLLDGLAQSDLRQGITLEEQLQRFSQTIPVKRVGEPSEIGDLCAYLCSLQAGYLTGQSIVVDGGINRSI